MVYKYSICTLVTDFEQYNTMKQSFLENGFFYNCEYLFIDNSKQNEHDGYSGVNHFINTSNAEYVIICHQDIVINFDKRDKLDSIIAELEKNDPRWGILGNAGGNERFEKIFTNLNDLYLNDKEKDLPQKVSSLDENFLLINKKMNISCSVDLCGFHFYGTDLCLQALCKGCHCYVVDFYLTHLGKGGIDTTFYLNKKALITKYHHLFQDKYIRTTCSKLFISQSTLKMKLLNTLFFLKIKTFYDRFLNAK